jgi:hypothetical protein
MRRNFGRRARRGCSSTSSRDYIESSIGCGGSKVGDLGQVGGQRVVPPVEGDRPSTSDRISVSCGGRRQSRVRVRAAGAQLLVSRITHNEDTATGRAQEYLADNSAPLASGLRPQVAAALLSRPAQPNVRPVCRLPHDRCARAQPRTWLAPESSTHGSTHRGRCRST